MQILVERDEFLRALGHVVGVAPKAATIPILSHLLLTVARESGTVRATDCDIDIASPFKVEAVSEMGQICVAARLLHDVIKRMPVGKNISLTHVEDVPGRGKLRIVCGKTTKFELATLSPDDYPSLSRDRKNTWRFEIEAQQLRGLLGAVKHAISKDETRHYLNGIHLHVTPDEPVHLKAVATTGHILALQSCLAPVGAYGMPGIIIPRETVAEMLKLLPDSDPLVTMTVSATRVWLDFPGGLSLGSKLLEGTYPDYVRVIPQNHPHCVRCDADALAASIDRVATISTDKGRQVIVLMNPKGGLTLTVQNPEIGFAQDRVETIEKAGKKAAIGFNAQYLQQTLASYSGAVVELRYGDAASAVVMTIAGDTSGIGLQIIMPQRHNFDAEKMDEAA